MTYSRRALGTCGDTSVHLTERESGCFEFVLRTRFTRVQLILEDLDELGALARLIYECEDEDGEELPPLDIECLDSDSSVQCVRETSGIIFTFCVDAEFNPKFTHLLVVVVQHDELGKLIAAFSDAHDRIRSRREQDAT